MIDDLLSRLRQRDRTALARLLTLVARGEELDAIATALGDNPGHARVVALTGSAGVGKSTLVGKLLPELRRRGLSVAVLACDPQSPLSGGALLGDRFRMGSSVDAGIFIRSVAAVGGRGAVAEHVELMIQLLEVFGFDVILLETVGAGQGDVAVSDLADVVTLLVQPESGDDVQWEKAGILELADVVAVNKSDLPAAEQTAAQLQAVLALTPERATPVVRVSSKTGSGIAELWDAIQAQPLQRGRRADPSELLRLVHAVLDRRWREIAGVERVVEEWQRGRLSTSRAVDEVFGLVKESSARCDHS